MDKLDKRGFDEKGLYHYNVGIKDTTREVDKYGFDYEGKFICNGVRYHFNHRGFEYRGINVFTGKRYDMNHFDIDGYYWKEYNGEMKNSYSKFDDNGLDLYGFNARGIHSVTGLPWDEHLFMADGTNIATNSKRNAYGYERDECYKTPRSVCKDTYRYTEEYLNKIRDYESLDKILYSIDSSVAKGIIADKTLRDEFMDICKAIEKGKEKVLIKKHA